MIQRYRVSGARGEAQAGFPHVITVGLPILQRSRRDGSSETDARLDALLAITASLDDTCLLHRGDLIALNMAQTGAAAVLAAGGTATVEGWELLQRLDRDLLALNASPGGSADLICCLTFYHCNSLIVQHTYLFTGHLTFRCFFRKGRYFFEHQAALHR